jgi:ATP-dependent helicase/DNAse subunit B
MPLTLVLGPANSAKAGEVLGAYSAAAARGAVLVVPTATDAEHYTRELVAGGALLGAVMTFGALADEIARRAGLRAQRLTERQRERLLERAVREAGLQRLASAAASAGFAVAAGELIGELQRTLITPARFASALTTWAGGDEARASYGRELAGLYFAYRRELERVGRLDRDLFAWRALDALRAAPLTWGQSPVFFSGFDDLHPLQRDAIETLAGSVGVEVTVSLTYEPGRAALAARAQAVEALRPLAEHVMELSAVDDYYAPGAREALHHLERHLFEPGAPRVASGGAVGLLEAGGERAEAELIATEVLSLLRAGIPGEQIAIVLRSPARGAGVLAHVLKQYEIAFAVARELPLGHTRLGRGLLALARCALLDQVSTPAQELLDYLRTPGVCSGPEPADRLEAEVRRVGVRSVAQARTRLTADLPELDALSRALDPGLELAAQARRLLSAPARHGAPVFDAAQELDARACAAVLRAIEELRELETDTSGPELIGWLERLPVEAGRPGTAGAVLISDPLSIRARRFGAVLVAGLQEGEFPRGPVPDPFLSDELRRELAAASGLRLRLAEDPLHRERYLLYACVSRATQRLVLSYRSSDEEGNLALPSPFLRDVADLLAPDWWSTRRRRLLADVVWPADEAPTEFELRRAEAASAAPATESLGAQPVVHRLSAAALAHVRHREIVSAGALESFADCPVKWLIERQLDPERLEPTAEPLARGSFMHDTLERVLRALGGPVTPETLPRARGLLDEQLARLPGDIAPGSPPGVRAAALAMIAADLHRYLEHEARSGADWRPAALEQRFGFDEDQDGDSLPALELVDGEERVRVRGAIDRIDVDRSGRQAIVRDYKSGAVRAEFQGTKWADERRLQVGLYMLAVRELMGLDPVAGLYQPLRGSELRPRGAYRAGAVPMNNLYPGDARPAEELEALMHDARSRAIALAARLRTGELAPCPSTCSRDGCRHPGICRSA